ncbi:MAG: hypothetical protein MZV70_43445 [Desulfobacterales bacterium]|nr:hypothetical protein [Desulfobacterales bacterium]
MDSPLIRKFQAGHVAAASAVRPDIRVSSKFAGLTGQAFNDPQKGYLIATRMYTEASGHHLLTRIGAGRAPAFSGRRRR